MLTVSRLRPPGGRCHPRARARRARPGHWMGCGPPPSPGVTRRSAAPWVPRRRIGGDRYAEDRLSCRGRLASAGLRGHERLLAESLRPGSQRQGLQDLGRDGAGRRRGFLQSPPHIRGHSAPTRSTGSAPPRGWSPLRTRPVPGVAMHSTVPGPGPVGRRGRGFCWGWVLGHLACRRACARAAGLQGERPEAGLSFLQAGDQNPCGSHRTHVLWP
jgi:hypothetical protein